MSLCSAKLHNTRVCVIFLLKYGIVHLLTPAFPSVSLSQLLFLVQYCPLEPLKYRHPWASKNYCALNSCVLILGWRILLAGPQYYAQKQKRKGHRQKKRWLHIRVCMTNVCHNCNNVNILRICQFSVYLQVFTWKSILQAWEFTEHLIVYWLSKTLVSSPDPHFRDQHH